MVKIEAIIRPQKLEAVQLVLEEIGCHGLTVTEVRGMGRQRGASHTYRGSQYTLNLNHKVKIEVVVPEELANLAIDAICEAAATGEVGDGKIFVSSLTDAVRIRTGEHGKPALD
jgi:nitrogen regulatory protein P-II 1